ncbi:hypothetical protein LIA77_05490 [Sarocladium implicatum]|nr:hypothetical protein LIA77_05490 [Sarocladium implicatum]
MTAKTALRSGMSPHLHAPELVGLEPRCLVMMGTVPLGTIKKFPSASRAWGEAHLLYTLMPYLSVSLCPFSCCLNLPRDASLSRGGLRDSIIACCSSLPRVERKSTSNVSAGSEPLKQA